MGVLSHDYMPTLCKGELYLIQEDLTSSNLFTGQNGKGLGFYLVNST